MQQLYSALWRLNSNDFFKGLVVAVLAAIFTGLAQILQVPGFNFGQLDWHPILQMAVMAGISYLAKNLATSSDGKILGVGGN